MSIDSAWLIGTNRCRNPALPYAHETLLDLPTVAPEIRAEYLRWVAIIGEESYAGPDTLGIHDVLKAHFLIADFFFGQGEGLGGLGPRDVQLLHSALYRQHIAFETAKKWDTHYEIAASLLFGLVKDHPFHDANKRTAFLATLYYLYTICGSRLRISGSSGCSWGGASPSPRWACALFAQYAAEGAHLHRQMRAELHRPCLRLCGGDPAAAPRQCHGDAQGLVVLLGGARLGHGARLSWLVRLRQAKAASVRCCAGYEVESAAPQKHEAKRLEDAQALGMSVLDGRLGSSNRAACSPPVTGSLDLSISPSCARMEAWSQ